MRLDLLIKNLLVLGMAAAITAACTDDMTEPSSGASVQIAQGAAMHVAPGDTVRLSASVLDGRGQPAPGAVVRWTSVDPTVARVDASGLVVAVSTGSTTVTATTASGASADLIVTIGPIREVDDRAALTALYEATDGPNWIENEGWLTDAPLEDWYGVYTDESGRVVALFLRSNHLTGELPAELGNLANLEKLVLETNRLTGVLPPELGNLVKLEELVLFHNRLTGEIPPELGNLANLRVLYLGSNELTGEIPPELGNLASLIALWLAGNDLTGEIPPELGNLANLVHLDLDGNELTGEIPPELGNLANLERLGLSSNELTGRVPVELASLGNLETIHLNGNRLTGALPAGFADLANLREMKGRCGRFGLCAPGTQEFMDFAEAIDYDGPFCHEEHAAALESVYRSAGGSNWNSSDGWLQSGPLSDWHGVETDAAGRVTVLDLSENGLSGVLPGSLSSLKSLQELRIGGNSELGGRLALAMTSLSLRALRYDNTTVCAPADPSFRNWLQSISSHAGTGIECPPLTDRDGLEVLYQSAHGLNWAAKDNWLTDAPLGNWYGVHTDDQGQVTGIVLETNGLTGVLPPELGNLANLQWLVLGGNDLTGEIPPELGNLANLVHLDLAGNDLAGEIPPELGNLANLGSLYLQSNDLTGEIPPELGNLANLVHLDLAGNDLAGEIPPELGNLANLGSLYLQSNDLTGEIPPELANLANLQWLVLGGNDLTGEIPAELGNLASLKHLDLSNDGLTGEIPAELGNLTNLGSLYLPDNGLTGEIPAELGNLASLKQLDLRNNGLTGDLPPELGNLANLVHLDLAGNDLTGEMPPELGNLANLQRLSMSHNARMSGKLPSAWTSLEMSELLLSGTGLCAPQDPAFQSWMRSIPFRHVSVCVERAAGQARAAAYVVQAVQSLQFPVPLVAGRPGLLRVFASVPQAGDVQAPAARATFYQRDGSERTLEVPSGTQVLTVDFQEGSLGASANVEVPGDVLRPGVEMVVEVDPAGVLDPGLGVPARIPATGRTALEVYELPSFDVTVVPFLWEADPDSSILDMTRGMTPDDSLFETTRRLLPVGAMSVTVHEPVWSSSNSAYDLLDETEAIRTLENGGGYWMGTIPEATDAAGVAWVPGRSQVSVPRSNVIAHEFGHNMHLSHAPCGGAGGPDPAYPDRWGSTGAWGWDRRSGRLVPPRRADLMSYCGPTWVGDYHFARSFRWRMHDEAGVAAFQGPPTRVLLLWGGADADGTPFLNPAFVVDDARASVPDGAGEWRIVGEAEDGSALFDRAFEMAEITDGDGRQSFVFALPAEAGWADALARIVLTGPGGEVAMDAQSGPAAALLRDPATGRVRGILRDWPDPATQADAAAAAPERGLEVQVSRGVPAPDAWRR